MPVTEAALNAAHNAFAPVFLRGSLKEALAAALEAASSHMPVVPGWQGMDSAPRDGTRVLLARHPAWEKIAHRVIVARWADGLAGTSFWLLDLHGAAYDEQLHGWMPLPAAPPPEVE